MDKIAVRPTEAAKLLGISRSFLYELLKAGEIESIRLGAARLIPVQSLYQFVARQPSAAGDA
ncbi:MAG TPA: helix-turn-helix domain-containing protein [Chloroflexota bacterium]|jgi:excisionase family DNA binding protein